MAERRRWLLGEDNNLRTVHGRETGRDRERGFIDRLKMDEYVAGIEERSVPGVLDNYCDAFSTRFSKIHH
jgi:hypothetical protein